MFRWMGDVIKKVLVNIITISIIGLVLWFVLKKLIL